jgi:ribosomal protein L40E
LPAIRTEDGRPETEDVICRYCGTEIADKALICYRCGNATTEPRIKPPAEGPLFERPRRSRMPVVIIVLIVLAILMLAWFELYR